MDVLLEEHVSQQEMNVRLLEQTTTAQWNELMQGCREIYGDGWGPDFSGARVYDLNLRSRDLRNANFRGADMQYSDFSHCDMSNMLVDQMTRFYQARFAYTIVTGCDNLRDCAVGGARDLDKAIGYIPPPPDVTADVARHMLRQAINDEMEEVCGGLREMHEEGSMKFHWDNDKLRFYMVYEIQKHIDICKDGHCDCETDHACEGSCDCCPCARGDCECEPDHCNESEPTDDWYLATVVGHIGYEWSDHRGLICKIHMDETSRHPHVSRSGDICWGDTDFPHNLRAADHLMTIMGWIGQHNPSDPYREIEDLPLIRKGW